jgi:subtilisin-like proprotein convertase family protein
MILCPLLAAALPAAPARADWCFCWMKDGSQSNYVEARDADGDGDIDKDDCNLIKYPYDLAELVHGPFGAVQLEGPDATTPVTYVGGNRIRYVVVVGPCRINAKTNECEEFHELWQCECNPPLFLCLNATAIAPGVWVPIGSGDDCECVTQVTDYPGCNVVNFHYHQYCRCGSSRSYYATDDPGATEPPGGPWTEPGPHGVPFPTECGGGTWVGRKNDYVPWQIKEWTVELIGMSADRYGAESCTGYDDATPPGTVPPVGDPVVRTYPGPPKKRTFEYTFDPQPEWEKVRLVRNGLEPAAEGPVYLRIRTYSNCYGVWLFENRCVLSQGRFGVPGEDSSRVTEIYLFPESVPIDPDVWHWFSAPPATGAWLSEPVYVDPLGEPRPLGGVVWRSDGPGLEPEHVYGLSLDMISAADARYDMFAFDAGADLYRSFDVEAAVCPCDCEDPRDGTVDVGDFLALLSQWGDPGTCDCEDPPDGTVDVGDFLAILAAWGPCPEAPVPVNDDCNDAIGLVGWPGGSAAIGGTTNNATVDDAQCVTTTTAPGVWYTAMGTGNVMTATTCEDYLPAEADFDTKISVFCGDCPLPISNCCIGHGGPGCDDPECEAIICAQDPFCCTTWDSLCAGQALTKCEICAGAPELICVDGNDDQPGCAGYGQSTVEWCSQADAMYRILVHGYGGYTGDFVLVVSDDGVPCPYDVECIPAPPTGACCQCDGPIMFCTQETEEDCLLLTGDPANFLGLGTSCEAQSEVLVYVSTPGVAIPDDDPVGVTDTITVTDSLTITDLDVDVIIDHPWVGDLCVSISKDGGPPVELIKRIGLVGECDPADCCGCSGDGLDVILDDEAAESIEDQCVSPITGTYHPDPGQLSAYDGLDAAGNWTLWVNDNGAADIGTLVEWSLHFALPSGPPPCEEALPDKCL